MKPIFTANVFHSEQQIVKLFSNKIVLATDQITVQYHKVPLLSHI